MSLGDYELDKEGNDGERDTLDSDMSSEYKPRDTRLNLATKKGGVMSWLTQMPAFKPRTSVALFATSGTSSSKPGQLGLSRSKQKAGEMELGQSRQLGEPR